MRACINVMYSVFTCLIVVSFLSINAQKIHALLKVSHLVGSKNLHLIRMCEACTTHRAVVRWEVYFCCLMCQINMDVLCKYNMHCVSV